MQTLTLPLSPLACGHPGDIQGLSPLAGLSTSALDYHMRPRSQCPTFVLQK